MGRREDPLLCYYRQDYRFAGLINGWLFDGEQVIRPEQLHPGTIRYTGKTGKKNRQRHRSRFRDIVKQVEGMKLRIVIGTEIQTYIDYGMPVRVADYDILDYQEQMAETRRKFKETHPGEIRLSALGKEDRLIPVFTFVLYFGEEPWDAGENLKSILDISRVPGQLKKYLPDYPVCVFDVFHTSDERLLEFPDDMACMFLILKYQKNKERLKELLERVEAFRHMDEDTCETIGECIHEPRLLELCEKVGKDEEGGLDMCQAIQEMIADERQAALKDGVEQGMEQGELRLSELLSRLLDSGRMEEVNRVVSNREYRKKLLQEFAEGKDLEEI